MKNLNDAGVRRLDPSSLELYIDQARVEFNPRQRRLLRSLMKGILGEAMVLVEDNERLPGDDLRAIEELYQEIQ